MQDGGKVSQPEGDTQWEEFSLEYGAFQNQDG
jgi:hypothetical protein